MVTDEAKREALIADLNAAGFETVAATRSMNDLVLVTTDDVLTGGSLSVSLPEPGTSGELRVAWHYGASEVFSTLDGLRDWLVRKRFLNAGTRS